MISWEVRKIVVTLIYTMTTNTKTTLIDEVLAALDSGNAEKLKAARYLVQTKCNHSGADMLAFLFTEVFPLYVSGDSEKVKIENCPYCGKSDCKGDFGLRTHVSRVHKDKFEEFRQRYL